MDDAELIKELWSLANVIAGFSIAQSLAFVFALGRDLAGLQNQRVRVKIVLVIVCVVFGALYSFGVFWCYHLATGAVPAHTQLYNSVWCQVTFGRIICIWLFTALPCLGLFARSLLGK